MGALDTTTIATDGIDAACEVARARVCKTTEASGLYDAVLLLGEVRSLARLGQWQSPRLAEIIDSLSSKTSSLSPLSSCTEVAAEINTLRLEYNNRLITAALIGGLSEGAAGGANGALDLSTVDVGQLNAAVTLAEGLGCPTVETEMLLELSRLAVGVRSALSGGDWDALSAVLRVVNQMHGSGGKSGGKSGGQGDLSSSSPSASSASSASSWERVLGRVPTAAAELETARVEYQNHVAQVAIVAALVGGRIRGPVGEADPSRVNGAALGAALEVIEALDVQTPVTVEYLAVGRRVGELRLAFRDQDWERLQDTVHALGAAVGETKAVAQVGAHGAAIPSVRDQFGGSGGLEAESLLIQYEVDNVVSIRALASAVSHGKTRRDVNTGCLDRRHVALAALQRALRGAEARVCRTKHATGLHGHCVDLLALRTALLGAVAYEAIDWTAVRHAHTGLEESLRLYQSNGSNGGQPTHDDTAEDEMNLVRIELDCRDACAAMMGGLSQGMAGGDFGSLDVSLFTRSALLCAFVFCSVISVHHIVWYSWGCFCFAFLSLF